MQIIDVVRFSQTSPSVLYSYCCLNVMIIFNINLAFLKIK